MFFHCDYRPTCWCIQTLPHVVLRNTGKLVKHNMFLGMLFTTPTNHDQLLPWPYSHCHAWYLEVVITTFNLTPWTYRYLPTATYLTYPVYQIVCQSQCCWGNHRALRQAFPPWHDTMILYGKSKHCNSVSNPNILDNPSDIYGEGWKI